MGATSGPSPAWTRPFAFVDLDAMWSNAADMLRRAAGKPIRVASKSVRCRPLLERILAHDARLPAACSRYTLPETLWLHEQGFDDLVVAYPTADRGALAALARVTDDDRRRSRLMVDSTAHLDLIESGRATRSRVCDRDRRRLLDRGRADQDRRQALARAHARAAVALAREIDGAARAASWPGLMALRGAHRRRRRPRRRASALRSARDPAR